MERFKITAVDPRSGKTIEGFLDGESEAAVRKFAEERGLKVLAMEPLGVAPSPVVAPNEQPAENPAPPAVKSQPEPTPFVAYENQGARRKHRPVIPALPEPAIPITPMLDMTFQLLFFFIMTFRPPVGEETEIPFSLPPVDDKTTSTKSKEPPPSGDTPPKFEANLSLILLSNPEGELRRVEIKGAGPADALVIPDADMRNHARVVELIQKELLPKLHLPFVAHFGDDKVTAKSREAIQIRLQASSSIKWELVVQVIDACRAVASQVANDPAKAVIALQNPVDQTGR